MHFFVTLFFMLSCCMATATAQTYTEHIQKQKNGQGSVTIHQSKQIEDLVNGRSANTSTTASTAKEKATATPQAAKSDSIKKAPKNEKKEALPDSIRKDTQHETKPDSTKADRHDADKKENDRQTADRKQEPTEHRSSEEDGTETPTVDMRKKIMRRSYKVTGYRVQAFAGGNSRQDRIKAEQIGSKIKMKYPDEPVYVHFYSPRWICRIGNYRSFEEANRMLQRVKAMGYRQASIVRGKITVQY
ncbi:SPOR domain-containing protein [Prevotella sp.]|uniref:SPOR domain-containing protein n=1 Tax=Prevotella sp. TaxID=59823 RepID=UPI002F953A7F